MARKAKTSEDLLAKAEKSVKEARTLQEYREAQSVLLPALLGVTLAETATVIGRSRATVVRFRRKFIAAFEGERLPEKKWGGRRRNYLDWEEEQEFLSAFLERAEEGGILNVDEVKRAFEERVGRKVAKSTIYRMLARHGWRKITPRRKHPKASAEEQEAFKKN